MAAAFHALRGLIGCRLRLFAATSRGIRADSSRHGHSIRDRRRLRHQQRAGAGRRHRHAARRSPRTSTTTASGDAGVLLDANDPNLARQSPADYIDGFFASVAGAVEQARSKRRLRAARMSSASASTRPVRRRSRSIADGAPLALHRRVQERARRAGLAVEGSHRPRRGGGDHRARPPTTRYPLPGEVRRHVFARVVLVEDPALQARRRRTWRRPPRRGSSWPISSRRTSRATRTRARWRAASAPPGTRRCTARSGAACRAPSFSTRSSPACRGSATTTKAVPSNQRRRQAHRRGGGEGRAARGHSRGRRRVRRAHGRGRRGLRRRACW